MSHLRKHKFKHNFQDCLNPICSCGLDIESTSHFLLHCPTFNDEPYTLRRTLNNIDPTLLELTKSFLSQTLLYGNTLFDKEKNTRILNATIEYILSIERLEEPLRRNHSIFRTVSIFRTLSNIYGGMFCKNSYLAHFLSPSSKNKKSFYIFKKCYFLAIILRNFLYFF